MGDNKQTTAIVPRESTSLNPDGRPTVKQHEIAAFESQPIDVKTKLTQEEWRTTAWILAKRAKELARSMTKKDAGRVQQAVTAAGIAYDKLYKHEESQHKGPAQLLIALFGHSDAGTMIARNLSRMIPTQARVIEGESTDA